MMIMMVLECNCNTTNIVSISMKEEKTITSIIANKKHGRKNSHEQDYKHRYGGRKNIHKECYIYKHKRGYNNISMNVMDRNTK